MHSFRRTARAWADKLIQAMGHAAARAVSHLDPGRTRKMARDTVPLMVTAAMIAGFIDGHWISGLIMLVVALQFAYYGGQRPTDEEEDSE